jgi:hypothetical protein
VAIAHDRTSVRRQAFNRTACAFTITHRRPTLVNGNPARCVPVIAPMRMCRTDVMPKFMSHYRNRPRISRIRLVGIANVTIAVSESRITKHIYISYAACTNIPSRKEMG